MLIDGLRGTLPDMWVELMVDSKSHASVCGADFSCPYSGKFIRIL